MRRGTRSIAMPGTSGTELLSGSTGHMLTLLNVEERTTRYRKSTTLDDHYVPDADVEAIPRHAHPVSVKESNYGVRPSQDHRILAPIMPPTTPDRVTVLHKGELWASDKIIAVSDGSLDPLTGRAAYAWVLTNAAETAHAKSSDDIWTNPKYMSSFRAKLEGVHDMLTYACKAGNTTRTLEIWCDNKGVLQVLDAKRQPSIVELSNSEGEMVQQTRRLLKQFPHATLNHFKGRQDDDVRYENLEY